MNTELPKDTVVLGLTDGLYSELPLTITDIQYTQDVSGRCFQLDSPKCISALHGASTVPEMIRGLTNLAVCTIEAKRRQIVEQPPEEASSLTPARIQLGDDVNAVGIRLSDEVHAQSLAIAERVAKPCSIL